MKLRKRISYVNVVATLALFLAIGGFGYAATKLPKNSVGSKQLKKNSVVTAKVKNEAITTAKIAGDAVTGAKLDESTLGEVPRAASAAHADSAANADAVNAMHVGRINFLAAPSTPETTVFSADGLTLHASCSATSQLEFTATTSVEHAMIEESGNLNSEFNGSVQDDLNPGMVEKVGEAIGNHTQSGNQGQLVYVTPAGDVVTAQFYLETASFGGHACQVGGTTNYS
jgi:hypothetical protein